MDGSVIRDLLVSAGVPIADRGHSVSRGNYNIRCPFCGAADKGTHMGIRLDNGWWACWRNAEHRGKSPVRLLVAVLNKPVREVRQLLGIHALPELSTFSSLRDRLAPKAPDVEDAPPSRPASLSFPASFRDDWGSSSVAGARFRAYLAGRGFPEGVLERVAHAYGLRYCISGDFVDRVILPYYYEGAVTMWTGRSIHPSAGLRYRDLEKEKATLFKDGLLYNYDRAARGGKVLLLLEGPFDVVKGDWAGTPLQVHCVGLSTNSFTDAQAAQLADLSSAYEVTLVGMDTPSPFARMASYSMVSRLRGVVDAHPFDSSSLGKDLGGAPIRAVSQLLREEAARV